MVSYKCHVPDTYSYYVAEFKAVAAGGQHVTCPLDTLIS